MIRLRDGVSEDYGVKHSSRASSIDFITSNLSHKAKVTPENLDWALKGKSNGCRLAEPLRGSPHSKDYLKNSFNSVQKRTRHTNNYRIDYYFTQDIRHLC